MLLLLPLSRFSRDRLCATPWTAAYQAPPSMGFSRKEHWSGLPFPSPMHESGKWKWSRVRLSATPWTAAYQAPPSMGFSRQEYWSGLPLPSPLGENGYMYMYGWVSSLFTSNYDNIVNQLYPNKNLKVLGKSHTILQPILFFCVHNLHFFQYFRY